MEAPCSYGSCRALDCRAVLASLGFLEALSLGAFKGDPALPVVTLAEGQVETAHHSVGRPGKPHHGGDPRQGSGVADSDAIGSQGKPAYCYDPKERANISDQAL